MNIIYLFIDGIGLGPNDPETNPFTRYARSFFAPLGGIDPVDPVPEGWRMQATDAHMGFSGLPQSATGQTSLWTGVSGPEVMGRHMTGFPGPTLIKVINDHSIVKQVAAGGKKATLLNAYSDGYKKRIARNRRLVSVSTHVQNASGQDLKTFEDLAENRAMFMDITHQFMHQYLPATKDRFPLQDPYQRGLDLVAMAGEYDLALFEYFLTDKAGHNQSFEQAETVIRILEEFLRGITDAMTPAQLLLVASDHGNLEDLSRKTHTHNPVPTFAYGKHSELILERVRNLADIPLLIRDLLQLTPESAPATGET